MPILEDSKNSELEGPSIWLIGGRSQQEASTDEIIRFNPNEMRSERLEHIKLPEKLNGLSVVSLKSKHYFFLIDVLRKLIPSMWRKYRTGISVKTSILDNVERQIHMLNETSR